MTAAPFSNFDFSFLNLAQFISLFSFYELHLKVFVYLALLLFAMDRCCLGSFGLLFDYQIISLFLFIAVIVIFTIFFRVPLRLQLD